MLALGPPVNFHREAKLPVRTQTSPWTPEMGSYSLLNDASEPEIAELIRTGGFSESVPYGCADSIWRRQWAEDRG